MIDDKFHEDEKRYLEDICEEEWELSVDEVQNVHDEIKDKGIQQVSKEYETIINFIQSDLKW